MSIQSEVDRINGNVASTYSVLSDLGADMPATTNTNNLPATATSVKAVLFGKSQSLTEAQKAQARTNIGAISAEDVGNIATTEEIVQQVIAALGTPVFGTVDENNVITLNADLVDGTYTLELIDKDGNTKFVGEFTQGVTYTNVLASAIDKNGNVYDGIGYKSGAYLSSSGTDFADDKLIKIDANCFATGFLSYSWDDLAACVPFYVKGVDLSDSVISANGSHIRFAIYLTLDEYAPKGGNLNMFTNATESQRFTITELGEKYYKLTPLDSCKNFGSWNTNSTAAPYARMSLPGTGDGVIITINEPIE